MTRPFSGYDYERLRKTSPPGTVSFKRRTPEEVARDIESNKQRSRFFRLNTRCDFCGRILGLRGVVVHNPFPWHSVHESCELEYQARQP